MLKRRTFFWLGILLFILALAAWAYHLYNKPHRSAGGETADFSVGADSLFSQYQKDEREANRKYLGKVLEVKGNLAEIQHNGSSEIWILSVPPGESPGGGGVNCQLFAGETIRFPRPKPGDPVTLKGRCTGFLMDVNLADCVPQ
jgi:hypothetical protein